MHLNPQEQAVGKENFYAAIDSQWTRRDILKQGIAAGAVSGAGLGALYFGYEKTVSNPLRVGWIGTGDEGQVLLHAVTPGFIQVVAIADIRPYNIWRAFNGDPGNLQARGGLMAKYGWKTEDEARRQVKVYDKDYHDLLANPDIEAVVIALPLHLHAQVAIEAMKAGKHVLTEKLMAHSVHECKEMGRVAENQKKILAVGHQRHYSILYDNAVDVIRQGLIGDIHYIRAQWHRGNLPGKDSWQPMLPDGKMKETLDKKTAELRKLTAIHTELKGLDAEKAAKLTAEIEKLTLQYMDNVVKAEDYDYQATTLPDGKTRTALEELIRWRLWNRTGGGLMAELGSHQLDAAGIFISGLRKDGEKALPLTVSAMGGRQIFPVDRDCEDHVYCMYEFPGPGYEKDKSKTIGVTYSSINGSDFGSYGETVYGTNGTLILEREQDVMLFKRPEKGELATETKVGVSKTDKGKVVLDSYETGGGAVGKVALQSGPPSRGYTEELEHWAWCIRNPDPANQPRCGPKIALGDAVIALTTNIALRENRRIEFDPDWFKIKSDATPENTKPDINRWA